VVTSARPGHDAPVLDQRGGNLALDLFVLDQHLGQLVDAALLPTGLTGALYAVYSQLAHQSQTPGQLTKALGVRPTTLSGYLSTMERRGHLSRVRHESDGRSRVLVLTPEGRQQWEDARPHFRRAIQALNSQVGDADAVEELRRRLGSLDGAVQSAIAAVTAQVSPEGRRPGA
jgi:DNA-binding MarR family transcriptional regulator